MRSLTALLLICFLFSSQAALSGAGDGGGGGYLSQRATAKKTPKKVAVTNYKKGNRYRDKAMKYEERAATATNEKKAIKYLENARKEYRKAINKYVIAVNVRPAFYQAHSELGYALRKIGNVEESLKAYDRAIQINPDYPQAIEYRAEIYLQLNRFDDVKKAYMQLFSEHPRQYAAQLMEAMERWVQQNNQDSPAAASGFTKWFKERQEISSNTVSAGG